MRARTHKLYEFAFVLSVTFLVCVLPLRSNAAACGFGSDIGAMRCRGFITATGAGTWTVPNDWNSADNLIELIGAGAGSAGGGHYGSSGGDYAQKRNLFLIPGRVAGYSVGAGGTGVAADTNPLPGGDTWFNGTNMADASVGARGGSSPNASHGDVTFTGGTGAPYDSQDNGGGPGGGAAGPNGNGENGERASIGGGSGGQGDGGHGGLGGFSAGASGQEGVEWDSSHGAGGGGAGSENTGNGGNGGNYGGGAGSGSWPEGTGSGGSGAQGIIVITYTPVALDTAPPVIESHEDVFAEATSSLGAAVFYAEPGATDAADGAVAVSCVPASGSVFPLGTTMVDCNAIDAAGNHATPVTFASVVRDTTPPLIALNGAASLELALNAVFADPGATAADAVDGTDAVTIGGDAVNTAVAGTYRISYDAADAAGNRAAQAIRTVVVDPPASAAASAAPAPALSAGAGSIAYGASSPNPLPGAAVSAATGKVLGASTGPAYEGDAAPAVLTPAQANIIVTALLRAFGIGPATVAAVQAALIGS